MADKKISQLDSGGAAQGTDELPIARSGANFKLTVSSVSAAAPVQSVNGQTGVVVLDGSDIGYDPAFSGLPATNVQDAIDILNFLVVHGTNSAFARPLNAPIVLWRGTAIPANPIGGDLWDETQTFYSPDSGIWTYNGTTRLWEKGTDTVSVDWVSEHTVAAGGSVTLNFGTSSGNRTIDWGDGTIAVVNTAAPSRTYTNAGTYQVRASGGTTTRLGGNTTSNNWRTTLVAVRSFGALGWISFEAGFQSVTGNFGIPRYIPPGITNLRNLFNGCASFNRAVGDWDIKSVTDARAIFFSCTSFNQPLANWDVSGGPNLGSLFQNATAFNQPINNWDMSSVTSISNMFDGAFAFNQPLNNWNTSNVTSMGSVFRDSRDFNQPIGDWDVSSATNMEDMFRGANNAFQQALDNWNFTGNVSLLRFFNGRTGAIRYNTSDYNALLVKWDALVTATTLAADRSVDMGGAQHSGAGTTARAALVAAGWTITDGGAA